MAGPASLPSPSTSVPLFSRLGVLFLAVALFWAAWVGEGMLRLLSATLLVAGGISYLWSRLSLTGVSYQRQLKESRCFPGESVEMWLGLENRKLLPLPWVEVEEALPPGLMPIGASVDGGSLCHSTSMLPYHRHRWRQRLLCPRRGYFPLGPARITSGDPLGFYRRHRGTDAGLPIVVYPQLLPLPALELPMRYLLGNRRGAPPAPPEPSQFAGSRDYQPGDPLRHIHWKATARQGRLQVKVLEPATAHQVVLMLPVEAFREGEGDVFELAVSLAASLAYHLVERKGGVGLMSNARLADSGGPAVLLPGGGVEPLVAILEALAKATRVPHTPFDAFLASQRNRLFGGATTVVIAGAPLPWLPPLLVSLKAAGSGTALLLGSPPGPEEGGWLPPRVACWRFRGTLSPPEVAVEALA